ncbi:MAG: hypothetical protein JNG84_14645 [Archangium sp.]|nr:hypothetical protein [Archangium sp.]
MSTPSATQLWAGDGGTSTIVTPSGTMPFWLTSGTATPFVAPATTTTRNLTINTAGRYQFTIVAAQDPAGPSNAILRVQLGNPPTTDADPAVDESLTITANRIGVDAGYAAYTFETTFDTTPTTKKVVFTLNNAWSNGQTTGELRLEIRSVTVARIATNFCYGVGQQPVPQFRLRSDFYNPGVASNAPPFAQLSTIQAYRNSGWGRADGGASSIFLAPAQANSTGLLQALGPCQAPTDLTTPLTGGFCMSDLDNCGDQNNQQCQWPNDAGMTDYTPLLGSVKNAKDFMTQELETDDPDQWLCRDYYVLIVTDGLEQTPRLYTPSEVRAAVGELRNIGVTVGSVNRAKDVKTFIIGFGAGLGGSDAGISEVDLIAREGGTSLRVNPSATGLSDRYVYDELNGRALSAQNDLELQQALTWVFSTISAGKFARSRPTISTDGQYIYQAYFERGDPPDAGTDAGSPELKGNLIAFRVETSGFLTQRWDYQSKLDNQAEGTRVLRAWLPDGGFLSIDRSGSNTPLADYLDAQSGWGTGAGQAVINFIRNDNRDQTYFPAPVPRTSKAAAIMFSTPVAVGRPPFSLGYGGNAGSPDEPSRASYTLFQNIYTSRPGRVIFGSNDGLFRGVAELGPAASGCSPEIASTCVNGTEAWGIMPTAALGSDALRTIRTGGVSPIIDGTTAVADVCANAGGAQNCVAGDWRTVAIGTMRGGGTSVFALDITDGGLPTPLWQFGASSPGGEELGLSYSVPSIGRVTVGSNKRWVAFMGGGFRTPGDPNDGDSFYILDALTGKSFMDNGSDTEYSTHWNAAAGTGVSLPGRPGLFRVQVPTPNADVDSYYLGDVNNRLWFGRVRGTAPLHSGGPGSWKPRVFFDPTNASFANYATHISPFEDSPGPARINRMNKSLSLVGGGRCVPGGGPIQDGFECYTSVSSDTCRLPLSGSDYILGGPGADLILGTPDDVGSGACAQYSPTLSPIRFFARPRIEAKSEVTGARPDLFIGTGNPQNLSASREQNYIFAIHDQGFTNDADTAPGAPLWLYALDPGEKVLGEPQFIGGSVIFATYQPLGSGCATLGDSYLYSFNPATGEPTRAIAAPSGVYTSTVKFQGSGPIDFIALKGRLYVTKTKTDGAPEAIDTREIGLGARVQGWRRVR